MGYTILFGFLDSHWGYLYAVPAFGSLRRITMSIDVSAVYKSTIEHFKQAQKNIAIEKRMFEHLLWKKIHNS